MAEALDIESASGCFHLGAPCAAVQVFLNADASWQGYSKEAMYNLGRLLLPR
jgi:hypothetical protein